MDLEQLSTSQLVLLTLFCSFVTSMATSVATVSLMQQTPVSAGQTVSQVIERTIHEVISPATSTAPQTPVPASDTSTFASIFAKVKSSVVLVMSNDGVTSLGSAVIVDQSGLFYADSGEFGSTQSGQIITPSNSAFFSVNKADAVRGIVFGQATSTGATSVSWNPVAVFRGSHAVGEDVFTIIPGTSVRLGRGIITSVIVSSDESTACADTDIPNIGDTSTSYGIPLFNKNGMLIGIRTHASALLANNCFMLFNIPTQKSSKQTAAATSTTN